MHVASVGVSKLCFLSSLALCGLLLILIPAFQAPQSRRGDRPRPRAQTRPSWVGGSGPGLAAPPGHLRRSGTGLLQERSAETRVSASGDHEPWRGGGAHPHRGGPDGGLLLGGEEGGLRGLGGGSRDPLDPKDVFIAVKTTKKYHQSRLALLLQTWVSRATEQTYIFTDGEDKELRRRAGVHVVNTNCSAAHTRQALCCKMSVEYDKFIESQKKWFCHVDDDNYVVLSSLLRLLASYHPSQDVYLGRPSLDHPIQAAERVKSDGSVSVKFWFATGGAGFCISRGLALKMSPWASLGNFISTAEKIRLPDDCTIGYIIEALLEVRLAHTYLFHSHLENLQKLPTDTLLDQVTLSYGGFENRRNVVGVEGPFSVAEDPSRFKTIHCLLYPDTDWCLARTAGGNH
ncbi:unnamed protein product [Merluccius merluccius]